MRPALLGSATVAPPVVFRTPVIPVSNYEMGKKGDGLYSCAGTYWKDLPIGMRT